MHEGGLRIGGNLRVLNSLGTAIAG